jgi:DNA-binding IclR family transcriptional regulator
MRRPVTDIALLAYIARKNAEVVSYTEATKACKSSSSASRALHQLIGEGLIEPKPKLIGLRYVTEYAITPRGKQVSQLALQITELREAASRMKKSDLDQASVSVIETQSQTTTPTISSKGSSTTKNTVSIHIKRKKRVNK